MTPQQIESLIDQKIAASQVRGQFGVSATSQHTHNNIDSLNIARQPFAVTGQGLNGLVMYAGACDSGGNKLTPFPVGWSVVKNSTGDFTITHNLNTKSYVVFFNAIASSTGSDLGVTFILKETVGLNSFEFESGYVNNNGISTAIGTDFEFLVIIVR